MTAETRSGCLPEGRERLRKAVAVPTHLVTELGKATGAPSDIMGE